MGTASLSNGVSFKVSCGNNANNANHDNNGNTANTNTNNGSSSKNTRVATVAIILYGNNNINANNGRAAVRIATTE